jgi:hypothetical protein
MLKQIGIRLEEEIIMKAKKTALDKGFTFQKLVEEALNTYIDNNLTIKQDNNLTSYQSNLITISQDNKLESYQDNKLSIPENDDYYLLRKTHKTKVEPNPKQYFIGPMSWMIMDGNKAHFDKDGVVIPFRFTDENNKVWEPDEEELQELSEYYGKPVKIEK